MIITRSPLRITLGGGGTDLPSYYEKHGGYLIAGAINKYVYITLHRSFAEGIILRYSKTERVERVDAIEHPIIREAMHIAGVDDTRLEISSFADIPAGTGLGSSGSFTTALLKALHAHGRKFISPEELAREACHIEIDRLKEPVGKQDQYIAAYGGLTCFEFLPGGEVKVSPLRATQQTIWELEDHLALFFTGYSRRASSVLQEQSTKSKNDDAEMIQNLHYVKEMGISSQRALEEGNLSKFGALMNDHWEHKKKRSASMSNPQIDRWYRMALDNGALGGKLIGAGGGGFLMFYTEDRAALRRALAEEGLREVRFHFAFEGTDILVQP